MDITFGQFLDERVKEKGLTIKKLSEISGITTKHLENLCRDNFSALPQGPYIYGYVHKLGNILEFDGDEWWYKIRTTGMRKRESIIDAVKTGRRLPKPQWGARFATIGICIALILAFIAWQYPRIIGKPAIILYYPINSPEVVADKNIVLRGKLTNGSEIFVNDSTVEIREDGLWEKMIALEPGINPIKIKAKKFLGEETTLMREIIYQPRETSSSTTGSNPQARPEILR